MQGSRDGLAVAALDFPWVMRPRGQLLHLLKLLLLISSSFRRAHITVGTDGKGWGHGYTSSSPSAHRVECHLFLQESLLSFSHLQGPARGWGQGHPPERWPQEGPGLGPLLISLSCYQSWGPLGSCPVTPAVDTRAWGPPCRHMGMGPACRHTGSCHLCCRHMAGVQGRATCFPWSQVTVEATESRLRGRRGRAGRWGQGEHIGKWSERMPLSRENCQETQGEREEESRKS